MYPSGIIQSLHPIFQSRIETVRAKHDLITIFSASVFCILIRGPTNCSFSPAARLDSWANNMGYMTQEILSTWKLHAVQNRPAD